MKGLWMLAVLVIGMIGAAWLTTKINYFTYGRNRERLEKKKNNKQT